MFDLWVWIFLDVRELSLCELVAKKWHSQIKGNKQPVNPKVTVFCTFAISDLTEVHQQKGSQASPNQSVYFNKYHTSLHNLLPFLQVEQNLTVGSMPV